MKTNIWIFSLEPLESRYTQQWHNHIPSLLQKELGDNFNVRQIDGIQKNSQTTPGAFLNFSDTNYWKSSQLCAFLELYNQGLTSSKDHFIFTDAWNPVIMQVKYMKDLLRFDWKVHALWHAGSYDPQDFLGRIINNDPWVRHAEKSFFHASDYNYFATDFHIEMFVRNLLNDDGIMENPWLEDDLDEILGGNFEKIVQTGWPMEYMKDILDPYKNIPKQDLILFPHRIAPEKQLEIFNDLSKELPQYQFVVCQDQKLTKDQYHRLLGQSKIVFSANLQETLGISTCAEGPLTNAIPLAPNRLSYTEIFKDHQDFLYPSEWTKDWESYCKHKKDLILKIDDMMQNYEKFLPKIIDYIETAYPNYFTATKLINCIKYE